MKELYFPLWCILTGMGWMAAIIATGTFVPGFRGLHPAVPYVAGIAIFIIEFFLVADGGGVASAKRGFRFEYVQKLGSCVRNHSRYYQAPPIFELITSSSLSLRAEGLSEAEWVVG